MRLFSSSFDLPVVAVLWNIFSCVIKNVEIDGSISEFFKEVASAELLGEVNESSVSFFS